MGGVFEVTFVTALAVAYVIIFGAIFRKAGYSAWWGLLMLVPFINLIWLFYFAVSDWPIHRELVFRRMDQGDATPEDNRSLIAAASQLENQGLWEEAIRVYDAIAAHPELASAVYATNCAQRLRDRMAAQQDVR